MSRNRRALIMAGGTGGHVFPGLALAEELKNRGYSVDWLGTQAGLESRLVPNADIPLHFIPVRGLRGKRLMNLLKGPFNILASVMQAMKIVKQLRPDIVVGLGGFVAGPGAVAAKLLGLPLVIHEQNAVAGTTNRVLTRLANQVLTAFPSSFPPGYKQGVCIGNPVRESIENIAVPEERLLGREGKLNILVVGGSRGAQAINEYVPRAFGLMQKAKGQDHEPFNIWHQAGDSKDAATKAEYNAAAVQARVAPFIDNMEEAFTWADFVICRSGALTVSELAAVGLGALFVPYPHAIDDHQTANAHYLVENGAAMVQQQKDISEQGLAALLERVLSDRETVFNMACLARQKAKPHAAKVFADYCEELVHA